MDDIDTVEMLEKSEVISFQMFANVAENTVFNINKKSLLILRSDKIWLA